MKRLKLENVSLIALTSIHLSATINALMHSSKDIDFGSVKLVSDTKPKDIPLLITHEYCNKMSNIDEWNRAMVYDLHKYVDTEFAILIHDDGFIVNPMSWRLEFLDYDYIGAPWGHKHLSDSKGKIIRVGNSVSLRSKRLMELPTRMNMKWERFDNNFNEDTQICVANRDMFLAEGMRYGDFEIAKYFSHEEYFTEFGDIKPFAFHNFGGANNKYRELINNNNIK
tara:strand:- start:10795 stop:11469 length:675 start_codon:yes stop_codon:yes gene_type:complete